MDVYAFYDCSIDAPTGQAAMVTLWERGWRNRGWTPRLITERHARRSGFYTEHKHDVQISLLALHAVGGGWFSPLSVMNFDFPPAKLYPGGVELPYGVYAASKTVIHNLLVRKGGLSAFRLWCASFEEKNWHTSPLVHFSDPTLILDCGRPL